MTAKKGLVVYLSALASALAVTAAYAALKLRIWPEVPLYIVWPLGPIYLILLLGVYLWSTDDAP